MSEGSIQRTKQRLHKMIEIIDHINILCKEKGDIEKALSDERLYRPAIMKLFENLYEIADKLSKKDEYELFEGILENDIKNLKTIRDISAYDYERIDLPIIEDSIRDNLPTLKENIQQCLKIIKDTQDQHKRAPNFFTELEKSQSITEESETKTQEPLKEPHNTFKRRK